MGIGSRLSSLLVLRGKRAGTLASETGISKNTIYGIIKRDNKKVDMTIIEKISENLGVSVDYFFDTSCETIPVISSFDGTLLRAFHAADAVTQRNVCKLLDIDCSDVYAPLRDALDRKIDEIEGSTDQRKA